MVNEFKVGKYYVFKRKTKPFYFNIEGKMDKILDGKPHKCLSVTPWLSNISVLAVFSGVEKCKGDKRGWAWKTEDFKEYKKVKNENKK